MATTTRTRRPEGMIGLVEAAKQLGTDPKTLASNIRRFGLPTYVNPLDARVRLLKVEDLNRLCKPVLQARTREGGS